MDILLYLALTTIFYRIGETDYNKGAPLALLRLVLFLVDAAFVPILGSIVANVLLFIALVIYNLLSKKPPGSQSGF